MYRQVKSYLFQSYISLAWACVGFYAHGHMERCHLASFVYFFATAVAILTAMTVACTAQSQPTGTEIQVMHRAWAWVKTHVCKRREQGS